MVRILFAWELGNNLGHLARDLPLARACRQAGYEVVMAVPNLHGAAAFLAGEDFTLVQAPVLRPSRRRPLPPVNYADMLLHEGYDDEGALEGALRGWEGLFALAKPRLMVYNHAPTALLAARAARLPVQLIGTGFEIPPDVSPLPSFRPWEAIHEQRLHDAEAHCLAQINACLVKRNAVRVNAINDLFPAKNIALTTFAELDPFGPRENVSYLGAGYAMPAMPFVSWEAERKYRVFAYLRPTVPGIESVLMALQLFNAEVVCAVPGLPPEWPRRFSKLRFFSHPVDLPQLLQAADLVITYGATTVPTALLAGVPVLAIPQVIEQYLSGLALEATSAGLMLRDKRTEPLCTQLIDRLLNDTRHREAARAFAGKYASGNVASDVRDAREILFRSLAMLDQA